MIKAKGIPLFIYADKAGWANQSSPKRSHFSQFVRACKELGITVIAANSAQAKGRVERLNKTMQDRLIPEFRLNKVKTMIHANQYLDQVFLPEWEQKFTVSPTSEESRYRPLPTGIDLDQVFCYKTERVVANDNCVHFRNRNYQILPGAYGSLKKKVVSIHEQESGKLSIFYGNCPLTFTEITARQRSFRRAG